MNKPFLFLSHFENVLLDRFA